MNGRQPREKKISLTPEMLALFARGCEIQSAGDDQRWEDDGGRRREYLDLDKRLNTLLQRPWCPSLFDTALDRERPPAYLRPDHQLLRDWHPAQQLRKALQHARRIDATR